MSLHTTKIRDAAINAAITVVATLFLTFGTGLWASKENASDHKADVQAMTAKLERILDVLCEAKPAARQCGASGEVKLR